MRTYSWAGLVAAAWALGPAPRAAADDFDGAALYEKCVKSCVFIVTPWKDGNIEGSGSLIDATNRYVITNRHVVEDVDTVHVQFPIRDKDGSLVTAKKKYMERVTAGDALKGKVLYRDKARDLALVQLDKLPAGTPALPLAKKSPRVGEKVINIGSPGKVESTFSTTEGMVRAVGMTDFEVGGGDSVLRIKARMVTVTNRIGPGDSGGPYLDRRGHLVAVMESGRFGAAFQNVNGAVDVTEVRAFLTANKVTIKEPPDEPGQQLKLTLAAKAKSIKIGEKPVFLLTVENTGDGPERLRNAKKPEIQSSWYSLYLWKDGKPVEQTRLLIGLPPPGPDDYLTLKPGEKVEFEMTRFKVAVANLQAGKYEARIEFSTWPEKGDGVLYTSPPAAFTVET